MKQGKALEVSKTALRDLPDHLLSEGTSWFTAREAAQGAGVPLAHVYPGLKRLVDRGQVFSPARGFYVPIPPEFRTWGSVPATHFVDAMMRHLNRRYYVGLLSAAELHGAAHQRPQVFQVMVDRPLATRRNGRTRLSFHVRSRLAEVPSRRMTTPTGYIIASTPEATVLDLASRPADGGGLDNVATVLVELAEEGTLDVAALAAATESSTVSALRRVGWMLDRFTDLDVSGLRGLATASAPTMLDPHGGRRGSIDADWRLILNSSVEPEA
ncbi:MAG: type IV toxin-antitoxin system AbiEi family antitoxin [Microthrixaceae bacterium]